MRNSSRFTVGGSRFESENSLDSGFRRNDEVGFQAVIGDPFRDELFNCEL